MKLPIVTNPAYRVIREAVDGYAYKSLDGLVIIQSISKENDGKEWVHTSFSRRSRMPEYSDMARVKRDFVGDSQKAVMVFPDKKHHVNIHPYCLHFFHCPEGDGIPEFSALGSI
jgi:hypothetical protein